MFPDQQQKVKVSKAVRTLQSVRVWTGKTDDIADTWEAAIRHFNKVSVSSCFLMEIDKGCLQPCVYDDPMFGEYIGSLVKNAAGVWELAVKTNVSQNRCRVFGKSPWWNLSCDDDVWLHEHATMNRAQAHDELCCFFADHKTMQIRPATTYDLSDKSRIFLLDLRDSPNHELEAIHQHIRNMQPYMLVAQHNDESPNDESLRALCEQQANQGSYFLLNLRSCPKEQNSTWDTSLGFCTNLLGLIRSFAEAGEDLLPHFDSARRVAEAAVESAIARFQRTGSARRWDGIFFTTWSTSLTENLAKVDRKKAERINRNLQKKLCQTFQTEAASRLACDQDRVLREHFPQVAKSHWEEILPPELEEIYEPRHLEQEEDEDDETETARALPEREKRELFRQHRNLGHPQPKELDRALRHAGARREAFRFVLKELRCPTCEARPQPLPPRPGMLPRCLRFNQCIGVDMVGLEVRDGTSAKASNLVSWGTGLQIVQPLWTSYTAKTVMKVFKIA